MLYTYKSCPSTKPGVFNFPPAKIHQSFATEDRKFQLDFESFDFVGKNSGEMENHTFIRWELFYNSGSCR